MVILISNSVLFRVKYPDIYTSQVEHLQTSGEKVLPSHHIIILNDRYLD